MSNEELLRVFPLFSFSVGEVLSPATGKCFTTLSIKLGEESLRKIKNELLAGFEVAMDPADVRKLIGDLEESMEYCERKNQ